MSAHAKAYHGIDAVLSSVLDDGIAGYHAPVDLTPIDLPNGTSSGQVSKVFTDKRTIAASGSENLDLAGSLTDALGAVLTFAVVKAIWIKADPGNANNVIIGGEGTDACLLGFGAKAHTWSIPPGGVFMAVHPGAGWTVTGGTGDILTVANSSSGTSVTYDIRIVG